MNAGRSSPVGAVVDDEGRLLSADPAVARLNDRAGGGAELPLALPPLAVMARSAARIGARISRRMTVADDGQDVSLRICARAEQDGVHLSASEWTEQPPWRPEGETIGPVSTGDAWRWEADAEARLTFISLEAQRLHGLDLRELLGQPVSALFTVVGEDQGATLLDAVEVGSSTEIAALLTSTGRAVRLSASVRTDRNGGVIGFAGEVRGSAAAQDDAGSMLPTGFGTGLERALRAPLARIITDADSIRAEADGAVNATYSAYAGHIANAGRHLLSLLDDLTDLRAIERSDFQPSAEIIDLSEIARRAAGLLAVRADQSGISIERLEAGDPVMAAGDFQRTLQVLVNLVDNAVRHSPRGGRVLVEVGRLDRRSGVAVSDSGQGIALQDQARIFRKFERLNAHEPGGTGLGLFISRRLAQAMGGDLTVASAPGEGARFTLTLPAGQPPCDE